jgi:spore coat protein U-like protein
MMKLINKAARASGRLLLVGSAAVMPTLASAQPASSTLSVNATVTANCTVSTNSLSFGNVNTISGANFDQSGGINVLCTNGTPWEASAGLGAGTGASFASRVMTSGVNTLSYNLYTDAARSTVWGDGTGTTAELAGTGSGSLQTVTVYGRVGSGQSSVPAGVYADTVSVTVSY